MIRSSTDLSCVTLDKLWIMSAEPFSHLEIGYDSNRSTSLL